TRLRHADRNRQPGRRGCAAARPGAATRRSAPVPHVSRVGVHAFRSRPEGGIAMKPLLLAVAGLLAATPAFAQDAPECELDRPVVFGDLNWGSAEFHTAVAAYIIRHGYGCETDSIPGDTIPLINGVARGDADLVMEIWTANPA